MFVDIWECVFSSDTGSFYDSYVLLSLVAVVKLHEIMVHKLDVYINEINKSLLLFLVPQTTETEKNDLPHQNTENWLYNSNNNFVVLNFVLT